MKPDFDDINYDDVGHYSPLGNKVGVLMPMAVFITNEESYDEKAKKQYEEARNIYNKYINTGTRFKPIGKAANADITARITRINPKSKTVSWKQDNFIAEQYPTGYKPAQDKWTINGMIHMIKNKNIEIIE